SIFKSISFTFALAAAYCLFTLGAQTQTAAPGFDHRTAMIAMRDGVRLNTEIFIPQNTGGQSQAGKLPMILERTPYAAPAAAGWAQGKYKELAAEGYIFVFQDIRGRYK